MLSHRFHETTDTTAALPSCEVSKFRENERAQKTA
jgi:hypothetical protein